MAQGLLFCRAAGVGAPSKWCRLMDQVVSTNRKVHTSEFFGEENSPGYLMTIGDRLRFPACDQSAASGI